MEPSSGSHLIIRTPTKCARRVEALHVKLPGWRNVPEDLGDLETFRHEERKTIVHWFQNMEDGRLLPKVGEAEPTDVL